MTPEQKAVLAHVVVDPDAWWAHVQANFPADVAQEHLKAKVKRWKPEHDREKAKPGYKNRVERDVAEKTEQEARRR